MITIQVWLLVSIGMCTHVNSGKVCTPYALIERFPTMELCEFVASRSRDVSSGGEGVAPLRCIQATIVKP